MSANWPRGKGRGCGKRALRDAKPQGREGASVVLRRGFRRRCQLRGASHSPELALLCLPCVCLPFPAHSGAAEAAEQHQAHHRIVAGGLCAVCLLFLPTTCRSFSLSLAFLRRTNSSPVPTRFAVLPTPSPLQGFKQRGRPSLCASFLSCLLQHARM